MMFLLLIGCGAISAQAQAVSENAAAAQNTGVDLYKVERGTNEFGVWGGAAFGATSAFGGLKENEARGRKFAIAAFRYGRTLAANDSVALQYTLDAIPLAIATGNITQATTVATPNGMVTTFRRETSYGGGLTPLGLQLDFRNRSRVKPFAHINAGFLYLTKPVPLPDAGQFAYTLEGGTGVRIFDSTKRAVTLGVRLHHISNGDRSGSNRGLNQFVFYAGFSIFK